MRKIKGCLLFLAMSVMICMSDMAVNASENAVKTVEINEKSGWKTSSGIAAEDFEKYCDEALEPALEDTMAGGAVAVISNGEVVFSKGYGYADIENEIPFSPSKTVFEYGSVSKLFTWTSAMQMYEQGKLDLQENIDTYLPEDFQRIDDTGKPVTMINLMNHQAGYDDYLIHVFGREENIISLREGLEEHKIQQIYEPGFATSYSNYGAALAGYVVENIVEEPFYEYVEKEIIEPLGMEKTVMNPHLKESLKQEKSKAYKRSGKGFEEGNWTYVSMYPAGSMNGTLEDLSKFANAYLEKNPVIFEKESTFDEMFSSSYEIADGVQGIAHGFIEFDGEYPTFWHNGGTENFSTFLAVVPDADFAIVACGNTEKAISAIQPFCFSVLDKQNIEMQHPQENLPDIDILAGDYKDYREAHRGILKIISLFREKNHVEVIGENHILINDEKYVQVEPYVFQSYETGRKCGFLVEDGKVVKYSEMLDYLPISWTTVVREYATYSVVILFVLLTLVGWTFFVIDKIKKNKKTIYKFFLTEQALFLTVLVMIFAIIDHITAWDMARDFIEYRIINFILGVILFGVTGTGLVLTRKDKFKVNWVYRMYSLVLMVLLGFMGYWGLFSIVG